MKLLFIQQGLSEQFFKLGCFIARHPLYFILIPPLITAVLSSGVFRMKINRDTDYLFTEINGRSYHSKKLVERTFLRNTSTIADVPRISTKRELTFIIIRPKNGSSAFHENFFKEVENLDRSIKNISVRWNNESVKYKTLCAKKLGRCIESSAVGLIPHIKDIIKGNYKVKYPLEVDDVTYSYVEYILSLGGVQTDEQGYIKDIKAIRLYYFLDENDSSKTEAITQWHSILYEKLNSFGSSQIILSVLSPTGIVEEFKECSDRQIVQIPFVIAVIAIFTFITCMTNDWIRSKPWLGPCSCISAVLAVLSGFGLMFHLGFDYVDMHIALGFAVLGTEVDDAFVLIASWRGTDNKETVENRMGKAYREAAVSVTITSLTNFLSFCIGISTPFPGVKLFCTYGATFIFFTYLYQITFFGGCMALSGYREKRRLHPFTFRVIKANASLKDETNEEFLMIKFRDKVGSLLTLSTTKGIVMLAFCLNLAISLYGLKSMEIGSEFSDGFGYDSAVANFTKENYKYFNNYTYPVHIIINEPLNYADLEVQNSIEECLTKFYSHPHIADSSVSISWIKYYKIFANHPIGKILLRGYNMFDKQDFIDGLRNVFLRLPQAKEFNLDVVFNHNFTDITSSRILLPMTGISDHNTEIQVMKDLYKIADESNLKIKVHSLTFHILEQAIVIRKITFETALVASALICVIFFIFVPNITCSLCISAVVLCIIIETVGYMSYWNVKLDIASLTTLILCVGFSINYPTHLSFSYVMAKGLKSDERIKKSLYEVGYPIFQGSISTILGVLVLAFEPYYGVLLFFKIIFMIALQTAFHAMFVIPVLLSVLGCCDKSLSCKNANNCVEKSLSILTQDESTAKRRLMNPDIL